MTGVFEGTHRRVRPLVSFWTGALYEPDDPEWADTREWNVQSADGDIICGGAFESFDDAQIAARLLAVREVVGWRLAKVPTSERMYYLLECWCGWSLGINGCHMEPLVPHVKAAHPEHPVVRG